MAHSNLPYSNSNSIPESEPDFPPRLIQRVDALSYMLPMTAPDGSRCMVVLTGSFAAWGACMSALVGADFVQAEPERWNKPSAWAKGGAE